MFVFVFATFVFVFVFAIFVFVFSTKVGLSRYPEDPGSAAKILLHRLPLVIKNILFNGVLCEIFNNIWAKESLVPGQIHMHLFKSFCKDGMGINHTHLTKFWPCLTSICIYQNVQFCIFLAE